MSNLQNMFDEHNGHFFVKRYHSDETKAYLSKLNSKPKSDETRAKMSAATRPVGLEISSETRAKMSAAQKKRFADPSASQKNKPKSAEARANMRIAQQKRHLNGGVSDETRAKMSAAQKKRRANNV